MYCIHPDKKASPEFHRVMQNLAQCFPNVFIASKLEAVVYASYSRLQAEINCMLDLLERQEKWEYMINLVGQVFPLKTNREIVKILKIYNGANDIEGMAKEKFMYFRINHKYKIEGNKLVMTEQRKESPPGKLKLVKGSAYGVFSRAFLQYTLVDDALSKELLRWSEDTKTPDEHFWATLNHMGGALNSHIRTPPGGFNASLPEKKDWLAVYALWSWRSCKGKVVRDVCVFGVGDLHTLVNKEYLFANKFYMDFEHLALDCMQEWYSNRTFYAPFFNTTYYENLPFIIPSNK